MIISISEDDTDLVDNFNKEVPSWVSFDNDTVLALLSDGIKNIGNEFF